MFNVGSYYSYYRSYFTYSEASIFYTEAWFYVFYWAYLGGTEEKDLKNYFSKMNFTTYSGYILSLNCRKRQSSFLLLSSICQKQSLKSQITLKYLKKKYF